jgi:hypothetical protein
MPFWKKIGITQKKGEGSEAWVFIRLASLLTFKPTIYASLVVFSDITEDINIVALM